jgi:CubicO group peptidase (beta-lactamase class C family)
MPYRLRTLTLALSLYLAVASVCTYAATPEVQPGRFPAEDALALAQPNAEQALQALPTIVQDIMQRSQVPGVAVAVVQHGKTVFAQGFGVRELGKPEPITPETVFLIASVSKSLTASVIATQVTQGKIRWDDPVVKYLPQFALSDPWVTQHVTVGDLMAHRSGLPGAAGDDLEDLGYRRREILQRLREVPLDAFRTSYHYANFGTTTAAQATAAAAGMPWEDLVEQALFKPLGMTSSSARHADYLAQPNHAVLHVLEDGRFQPLYDRNPDAQAPAGGVSSNVLDLANWLKFLLAGGQYQDNALASPESLLPATQPQAFSSPMPTAEARPSFYGYGFNVGIEPSGRVVIGHSGGFVLGAATYFRYLPSADIGIVVLTNGSPIGVPESIASEFTDLVQYGKPLRDWYAGYNQILQGMVAPIGDLVGKTPPESPEPAQALQHYVGTYANSYFGPAVISVEKDRLIMTLGPKSQRYPLTHWSDNTFSVAPLSENEPKGSLSSVSFNLSEDGNARQFVVDYLNRNGLGRWTRQPEH